MGWLRGDLTPLQRLAVFADSGTRARETGETEGAETPAALGAAAPNGGANAPDAALLGKLEILLELELLEGWDPGADLPIPVNPAPVRGRAKRSAP